MSDILHIAQRVLTFVNDRVLVARDDLDAHALLQLMRDDDHEEVLRLLALIEKRGFHRGKDLQSELASLLASSSG